MTFTSAIEDRYFEDYAVGGVHRLGSVAVDSGEMLSFARHYDPQPIHTNAERAVQTPFGGIIASGWYTMGLMMRLYVDKYLTHVASLASPGVDEVRWQRPVRAGDVLDVKVTVLEAAPSRTKPDRGVVTSAIEVTNQSGELVMSLNCVNMIRRRQPG